MRDARHDSRVEQDPPAGYRPDVDQGRLLIVLPAPTEPQVTNVTSTSTARIAVGDDKRIPVWVLLEPAPCGIVEFDDEVVHHAIMRVPAYTTGASRGCPPHNDGRRCTSGPKRFSGAQGRLRHHPLSGRLGPGSFTRLLSEDLRRQGGAGARSRHHEGGEHLADPERRWRADG